MVVSYDGDTSKDINRILNKWFDVRYTIPKKLDLLIKNIEDKFTTSKMTKLVYKINCCDCDLVYIGQTKRHLITRMKEHQQNDKWRTNNYSVVTDHRLSLNHNFDWSNPNVLHSEKYRRKREIAEMISIKKFDNSVNLQKDTENLNPIYNRIISLT